ncbi:MAG: C45 family peptidase [Anaerobacillus sp.]
MSRLHVTVEQYRGSSYEVGYGLGSHERMNIIRQRCEHFVQPVDVDEARGTFQTFAPHLLEELHGIAKALGISQDKALSLFSAYDLPILDGLGCTAIMMDQGYVRNYDFGPDFYDGRLVLRQPKEANATCGHSLFGIGLHDGMNEHGLTAGLHFVSTRYHQKGYMAGIVVRMILDQCSTVHEAITLLRKLPHADEYNYSLTDATGRSAIVEAGPFVTNVLEKEHLFCTNHFQRTTGQQASESSLKRLNYLKAHEPMELTGWFDEFRDPESPLFFHDYENLFGTLHTIMIDPKKLLFTTSIAGDKEVLTISFEKWLQGEVVEISELSATL